MGVRALDTVRLTSYFTCATNCRNLHATLIDGVGSIAVFGDHDTEGVDFEDLMQELHDARLTKS